MGACKQFIHHIRYHQHWKIWINIFFVLLFIQPPTELCIYFRFIVPIKKFLLTYECVCSFVSFLFPYQIQYSSTWYSHVNLLLSTIIISLLTIVFVLLLFVLVMFGLQCNTEHTHMHNNWMRWNTCLAKNEYKIL